MFDVLCLSDCCCDLVFEGLPALPAPGGEEYCRDFAIRAGGGANTPMGLGLLGLRTAYASVLGQDVMGSIVLDALRKAQVANDFLTILPNGRTWVSAALSTASDRSFASFAGASHVYTADELHEMVRRSRWVHTYCSYARQYPALAEACQALGVPLSLDFSYDPSLTMDEIAPILRRAALIKPNAEEACLLTHTASPLDALQILRELTPNVVITLGADGCFASLQGQIYRAYTPQLPADLAFRDATGAGDLFCAGLIAGIIFGKSAEQLQWACASGTLATYCLGGVDAYYTRERVMQLAQTVRVESIR